MADGPGRPRKEVDWDQVDNCCIIQCTAEEIASVLKISVDTLERRCRETHDINIAEYIRQKSAGGKASLRRRQFKKAVEEGNSTMLIWLGKQYLGQKDNQIISGEGEDGKLIIQYSRDRKPNGSGDV